MFTQSEYNSFNFDFRIKIPIIKLKDENISVGKTMRFFKNIFFFLSYNSFRNFEIVIISKQYIERYIRNN